MSMCPMCLAGLKSSCLTGSCDSNPSSQQTESSPILTLQYEKDSGLSHDDNEEDSYPRYISRRNSDSSSRRAKRSANLKDQQSTGRKRAARLFPLDPESPCEWAGSSNCGGGTNPITGCLSGKQQARHHGPIKDTTINDEGNVHRICHYCHNRWHAKNDVGYDWNQPDATPHSPLPMTEEEQEQAALDELIYKGTKESRLKIKD